jgi:hypothetical protein
MPRENSLTYELYNPTISDKYILNKLKPVFKFLHVVFLPKYLRIFLFHCESLSYRERSVNVCCEVTAGRLHHNKE